MKSVRFLIAILVVSVLTVACGGNNPVVPPPVAQYPNAAPGTPGYGGYGGSCGAVGGGQPLHADNSPFFAALQSLDYSGGSASNSLSVNLNYMSQYNADAQMPSIVGSGTLNFPDIQALLPPGSQLQTTAFCVSSASPQGGNVSPGVLYNGGAISNLVLTGVMQTPNVSPFGGYPGAYGGGMTYGQTLVEVAIGAYGGAGIQQGRLLGSVVITIGAGQQGSMTLRYNAQ